MASCKDCIHVEVCSEKNLHVAVGMNITPRFKYKRIEQECDHFKDRSRFAEIPSTIYTTIYGDVSKIELLGYFGEDKRKQCVTVEPLHFKEKIVFLTGEEAEQALQEKRQ